MKPAASLCALLLCAALLAGVGHAAPDGGDLRFSSERGEIVRIIVEYENGTYQDFIPAELVVLATPSPRPQTTSTAPATPTAAVEPPGPTVTQDIWPAMTATPTPTCRGIVTSKIGVRVRASMTTNSAILATWGAGTLFAARGQIGEWWQVDNPGGYVWAGAVEVACPS